MLNNLTSVLLPRNTLTRWTAPLSLVFAVTVILTGAIGEAHSHSHASGDAMYTMYRYPVAAGGSCMPSPSGSASSILRENGIAVRGGATSGEMSALAKGINQIQRLLGHPLPRSWRTSFNFINTSGRARWNQGANAINVRRPRGSSKGENVARMMHELGHRVGNSGAYAQYTRATHGQTCAITGYAATKRNEQFAEVFSAYVTYPDLLAKKCPSAYRFFSERLFPGSSSKVATCSSADRLADRAYRAGRSNREDLLDRDRRSTYISNIPYQSRSGYRSEARSSGGTR